MWAERDVVEGRQDQIAVIIITIIITRGRSTKELSQTASVLDVYVSDHQVDFSGGVDGER